MTTAPRFSFEYIKRTLQFKFEAGTSRGVLKTRNVYWIKVFSPHNPTVVGWGEAAPLVKLSIDDRPDFEAILSATLKESSRIQWNSDQRELLFQIQKQLSPELPSIRFGIETALLDLFQGGKKKIFDNDFYDHQAPIPINGLIWMGNKEFMIDQIEEKLAQGFACIKMKIGAIDFEQELGLLKAIRARYSKNEIVLRVDANGAFEPRDAIEKLNNLAELDIHSIEQPIAAGQVATMKSLCRNTPLPIALDEELIGVRDKASLLDAILPQHIILKPSLVGGIAETEEWIKLAEERNIGWWMTSALESNIGLNAIAQLASKFDPAIPQGLGTGKLYHNNLQSPLEVESGKIKYNPSLAWETPVWNL